MPSINYSYYKNIRSRFDNMSIQFNEFKNSHKHIMENGDWEDLFQRLYSISDFYDNNSDLEVELKSLLSSQKFNEKQTEYEAMYNDTEYMISEVKYMYREIKDLCNRGGEFSDSELRSIQHFRIDSMI